MTKTLEKLQFAVLNLLFKCVTIKERIIHLILYFKIM